MEHGRGGGNVIALIKPRGEGDPLGSTLYTGVEFWGGRGST